MNIAEVSVLLSGPAVFNGNQLVVLIGGQVACAALTPGEFTAIAYSSDVYDPENHDPKAWRSNEVHGTLDDSETIILALRPGSYDNGTWNLQVRERQRANEPEI